MDKLNTHYYDGKLDKKDLEKDIFRVSMISNDEKMKTFIELLNHIKSIKVNGNIMRSLYTIIDTFRRTGRSKHSDNYSKSNDLYACDLLYLCCERLKLDKDFLELFLNQMNEMVSGLCSDGRCTRLFQILIVILNVQNDVKNEELK